MRIHGVALGPASVRVAPLTQIHAQRAYNVTRQPAPSEMIQQAVSGREGGVGAGPVMGEPRRLDVTA